MSTAPPTYGGRALRNGVMMVGDGRVAVSLRMPDGTIHTQTGTFVPLLAGVRRVPFLRGLVAIAGTLMVAIKSASLQRVIGANSGGQKRQIGRRILPIIGLSLAERVILGVAGRNKHEKNRKPGLVSMFMPLVVFRVMGTTGPGRDLLKYHGAEHTVVNAAEAGRSMSLQDVTGFSRIHPRCGTTFAVWALLLTRLFRPWVKGGARTAIASLAIVSVAFELLQFGSRHRDEAWVRKVFGITWQAQLLTTLPPDSEHLEVAAEALRAVMSPESRDAPLSDAV
jgi:uncharacterized protein YqhQ